MFRVGAVHETISVEASIYCTITSRGLKSCHTHDNENIFQHCFMKCKEDCCSCCLRSYICSHQFLLSGLYVIFPFPSLSSSLQVSLHTLGVCWTSMELCDATETGGQLGEKERLPCHHQDEESPETCRGAGSLMWEYQMRCQIKARIAGPSPLVLSLFERRRVWTLEEEAEMLQYNVFIVTKRTSNYDD